MTFKNTKTYEGKRKNTLTVKKCEECLDITLIESYEDRRKISTHLLSIDNAIALRDYLNEAYPQWISVEDKLPEEHQTVLAIDVDGFYALAFLSLGEFVLESCGEIFECVTHWQPLPNPPEGKDDE